MAVVLAVAASSTLCSPSSLTCCLRLSCAAHLPSRAMWPAKNPRRL